VPASRRVRQPGLVVHRRKDLAQDLTTHDGIPLTSLVRTLIDLATRLGPRELEAAVNEADKLDLIDPESLRRALGHRHGQPGTPRLRRLLDRASFSLTDSELERRFIPIARRAGLPRPLTQQRLHGFRVDFHWPHLDLVVETDGLRYHRTPTQQSRDRSRDQALTAAGFTVLRFTHAQIRYDPDYVRRLLEAVADRIAAGARR
jgi:very-short-patch-repair endonuclease